MTEPLEPPPPPMLAPMPSLPPRAEPAPSVPAAEGEPPPAAPVPPVPPVEDEPTTAAAEVEDEPTTAAAEVEDEPAPAAVETEPVAAEPVEAEPVVAQPAGGPVPRAAVFSLLALAVAVSVLLALVTVRLSDRQNGGATGQADVTSAASSAVATVLSYDYRHLTADFAAADRLLTPRFRKQYDATTAKGVQPLATKYKAVSTATVAAAGVVSVTGDSAVVLVFVEQTVTNTQLSAPRLDRSRIDVNLVRSNGHWLIDKLTPL